MTTSDDSGVVTSGYFLKSFNMWTVRLDLCYRDSLNVAFQILSSWLSLHSRSYSRIKLNHYLNILLVGYFDLLVPLLVGHGHSLVVIDWGQRLHLLSKHVLSDVVDKFSGSLDSVLSKRNSKHIV